VQFGRFLVREPDLADVTSGVYASMCADEGGNGIAALP